VSLSTDLRSDTFNLGPMTSPGKCEIIGASDGRKWDEQAGFGLSGAALVGGGAKLSHFAIKLTIWEPAGTIGGDWSQWQIFKKLVEKPLPGIRPPSWGIYHPQLADVGIDTVVVEDRTQWTQDEQGLWTMQIKFIQYRAPIIMSVKAGPGVPAGEEAAPTMGSIYSGRLAAAQRNLELAAGK